MKISILLILLIFPLTSIAQAINMGASGNTNKNDSISKQILEPTKYSITYKYEYAVDSEYPDDKREGLTLLQIGNRYNRFWDYNEFKSDSIFDRAAKENLTITEFSGPVLQAMRRITFSESILMDKHSGKEIIQRTAGLPTKKYQYEEVLPSLKWNLVEGDSTIADYHCKKATTNLFGREYIAWYCPAIDLPYGPYKFNGLPGLIFKVVDTQNLFNFTIQEIKKENEYHPIYYWTRKDLVKSDRKTIRKIYKNFCLDPLSSLLSDGNIKVSDKAKAKVKSRPYNPIELE
ncbi:MAG: GLPGLI family protein [Clostridia bacterium]|nr:GLPGLI family protein [Clostridia bacterium]